MHMKKIDKNKENFTESTYLMLFKYFFLLIWRVHLIKRAKNITFQSFYFNKKLNNVNSIFSNLTITIPSLLFKQLYFLSPPFFFFFFSLLFFFPQVLCFFSHLSQCLAPYPSPTGSTSQFLQFTSLSDSISFGPLFTIPLSNWLCRLKLQFSNGFYDCLLKRVRTRGARDFRQLRTNRSC